MKSEKTKIKKYKPTLDQIHGYPISDYEIFIFMLKYPKLGVNLVNDIDHEFLLYQTYTTSEITQGLNLILMKYRFVDDCRGKETEIKGWLNIGECKKILAARFNLKELPVDKKISNQKRYFICDEAVDSFEYNINPLNLRVYLGFTYKMDLIYN